MTAPLTPRNTLRDRALHDDPTALIAAADLAAWERAEGLASDAAASVIRRRDVERLIPGLPARRTFMVLGWVTLAAFLLDSVLAWLPPADWVDTVDLVLRYGTAGSGVAVGGWSILSEVRGWEGSDASTWFLKARVDRYQKKLEPRRAALRDTVIAIGAGTLVVYREDGGAIVVETFAPDAIIGLSLEHEASHVALQLTTRDGVRRFGWLRRDPAIEAAVKRFHGGSETTEIGPDRAIPPSASRQRDEPAMISSAIGSAERSTS